ncbi:MAG: hypothetical protein V3T31_06760, partial [candidate division Zixibacteria bacterium]
MVRPSQTFTFDNRLVAIEELFRQRNNAAAIRELDRLKEEEFSGSPHQRGLFLLLTAERAFCQGNYRQSIESALIAARLLADYPLNRQYGRTQLVLSKSYSSIGDMRNAEIRGHNALAAYRRASDTTGQIDGLNELARTTFIRSNYEAASSFLDEAIELAADNPRKVAQLTGNVGMIRTLSGLWDLAEADLKEALTFNIDGKHEISQAVNHLALGYLYLRKREFVFASRSLEKANAIIGRLNLKREKIIYLEYSGELAYERGEMAKARAILSEAYQQGML